MSIIILSGDYYDKHPTLLGKFAFCRLNSSIIYINIFITRHEEWAYGISNRRQPLFSVEYGGKKPQSERTLECEYKKHAFINIANYY